MTGVPSTTSKVLRMPPEYRYGTYCIPTPQSSFFLRLV
jgi:hypothetical protein